ncbi:hypothetical protein [Pedobacter sp. P26]|uniref:hypothetical protein n=1 Tax=Pedobacter sp. P26 TaxID=3423956 RepID=UPI003D66D819
MVSKLKLKIKDAIASRSNTARSIFSIFVLRGGNILIQLLIIPLSIKYVSSSSFGLWLTVSSMIAWLNIMDIGLSAGLRNKLTEAITLKDKDLAKSYVSTTYALLSFMALGGLLVCTLLIFFLDWRTILTIPKDLSYGSFEGLLCIVAISFFISFLLKPISGVAYATHKPETEYFILFISNLINILLIWGVSFVYPGEGY